MERQEKTQEQPEKIIDDQVNQTLVDENVKVLMHRMATEHSPILEKEALPVIADNMGIPYMPKLAEISVPYEFVENISLQFAQKHNLIAVGKKDNAIEIATAWPINFPSLDDVGAMIGMPVDYVLAPKGEIAALIKRAYQNKSTGIGEMLEEIRSDEDINSVVKELEQTEDLMDVSNKAPIIKLVSVIISEALKNRASDIHFHPHEDVLKVRGRIDGVLYDMMDAPKKIHEAVISRIKVMAKLDIAEKRSPQDGRATIRFADREIDIRVSVIPTSNGERIVLRLLDRSSQLYTLKELGMAPDDLSKVSNLIDYSHGIIFVTGPTGSGKTTTLYAVLSKLNSTEKNIITIEDPIEYQLPGISQMQIAPKKDLTFATCLRSVVRQDPDILMVGEVRDKETATIAIQSALTGHLIFSTIHTNDAAGAITRLLDIGIEPYLASSSMIAVIAQRLVRTVCSTCKVSYTPEEKALRDIGLKMDSLPDGLVWNGTGCADCRGTGYRGRTGIFEVLVVTDEIREMITDRKGSNVIKQAAIDRGQMKTLRMDGANKVVQGFTTIGEVLARTQMDLF